MRKRADMKPSAIDPRKSAGKPKRGPREAEAPEPAATAKTKAKAASQVKFAAPVEPAPPAPASSKPKVAAAARKPAPAVQQPKPAPVARAPKAAAPVETVKAVPAKPTLAPSPAVQPPKAAPAVQEPNAAAPVEMLKAAPPKPAPAPSPVVQPPRAALVAPQPKAVAPASAPKPSGPGDDAAAGLRGAFAQRRPLRRGGRQGARGLSEAASRPARREARARRRKSPTWSRRSAASPNITPPTRSAPSRRRPRCRGSSSTSGRSTLRRLAGEETPPVAAPEPGDKRFADPEWRANPYFDFIKQAYVLTTRWADDLVKRADETRPAHPRQGRLLSQAGDERAVALEFPRHQSRTAARDARRERRKPRARPAHDGRGHRGRPRPVAHPPGRRRQVQARRQSRRHARQGDLPQRTDRADPIRAVDAGRSTSARC